MAVIESINNEADTDGGEETININKRGVHSHLHIHSNYHQPLSNSSAGFTVFIPNPGLGHWGK